MCACVRAHPTESHDLFNWLAKKLVCSVATLVTEDI